MFPPFRTFSILLSHYEIMGWFFNCISKVDIYMYFKVFVKGNYLHFAKSHLISILYYDFCFSKVQ